MLATEVLRENITVGQKHCQTLTGVSITILLISEQKSEIMREFEQGIENMFLRRQAELGNLCLTLKYFSVYSQIFTS